ncbi:MAG: type II toxin-antitoxin system prevent-host-death family antitoxin [bacterium]|nr:type II toxin-antitoxin system prevent-host-death family antitoxin [bacterium]
MSTTITATEAARRFSDLLNRVRYRGEIFRIVRSGEEVAQLAAPSPCSETSLRALLSKLQAERTGDPEFADELERIQTEQPAPEEGLWDS